jgi:hypothetical protein
VGSLKGACLADECEVGDLEGLRAALDAHIVARPPPRPAHTVLDLQPQGVHRSHLCAARHKHGSKGGRSAAAGGTVECLLREPSAIPTVRDNRNRKKRNAEV